MTGVLGVLLAGGRGTRLGGALPKALAVVGGRTLLARQLATLAAVCDEVVVSASGALALPVSEAQRTDDPPGAEGPLAGLVGAFAARQFVRACVLGVDLPGMTPAAFEALERRRGDALAAIVVHERMVQPLLGVYAAAARSVLAAHLAAGGRALVPAVLALSPVRVEAAAIGDPETLLLNVNTPAEAREAELRLAGGTRT